MERNNISRHSLLVFLLFEHSARLFDLFKQIFAVLLDVEPNNSVSAKTAAFDYLASFEKIR